jgi:hypothetical protein
MKAIMKISSGMLRLVVWQKFTNVSEVLAASIIRAMSEMMETTSISETSVNFYEITRRNIPEDSHFHSKCCSGNLAGRDDLRDPDIDGVILLKWLLEKKGVRVWTG